MACEELKDIWDKECAKDPSSAECLKAQQQYGMCLWMASLSPPDPAFVKFDHCVRKGGSAEECFEKYLGHPQLWIGPSHPRPDELMSDKVRAEIFRNSEKAMIFSKHLDLAFKEMNIKLKEDETYVCLVYVAKEPIHISKVVTPASAISGMGSHLRVNCIMKPAIMEKVMKAVDRNKIKH